ncbi:MAG: DUF3604 domain-containing protein, partial [Desulfobacterales bacterium]|nr:DUF3604 domain-containing protein [Desulfobacterales bacterium]
MKKRILSLLVVGVIAGFTGAPTGFIGSAKAQSSESGSPESAEPETGAQARRAWRASLPNSILTIGDETVAIRPEANAQRNAYFGDLHVHTSNSFDAFAFGTLATPYDAYRYAKGEAIKHPGGFDVQLREPLDFYGVTDHAMFLGIMPAITDTSTAVSKYEIYEPLHDMNAARSSFYKILPESVQGILDGVGLLKRLKVFGTFIPKTIRGLLDGTLDREMVLDVTRSAWADSIQAAEKFNDPG